MKNRKTSTNARKAFENFKEELAKDMDMNRRGKGKSITKKIKDKTEEFFENLGRS